MSNAKKKQSISDQINEVLRPKELNEENDETEARFEEFTEHSDDVHQLSDIRKQTAKNLSELDTKYKGKVVSRKELEEDVSELSNGSSDEDEQPEEGNNYATDSDESEKSDDELVEEEEEEEESEEFSGSEGEDDSNDDLGDDFDLSQFSRPQSSLRPVALNDFTPDQETKTKILKDTSLNEEIKKGVCVQNQLKLWEKLLEVRIKSQKMLITANSFPDYDAHLELSSMEDPIFTEKVDRACDGLHGLLDNLLELQSTLVGR